MAAHVKSGHVVRVPPNNKPWRRYDTRAAFFYRCLVRDWRRLICHTRLQYTIKQSLWTICSDLNSLKFHAISTCSVFVNCLFLRHAKSFAACWFVFRRRVSQVFLVDTINRQYSHESNATYFFWDLRHILAFQKILNTFVRKILYLLKFIIRLYSNNIVRSKQKQNMIRYYICYSLIHVNLLHICNFFI